MRPFQFVVPFLFTKFGQDFSKPKNLFLENERRVKSTGISQKLFQRNQLWFFSSTSDKVFSNPKATSAAGQSILPMKPLFVERASLFSDQTKSSVRCIKKALQISCSPHSRSRSRSTKETLSLCRSREDNKNIKKAINQSPSLRFTSCILHACVVVG